MTPTISLTPKQLFIIIVLVGTFIAGYITRGKFHDCPVPVITTDTLVVYQTVIDEKVIPIFKTKIEKDTIYSTDTLIIDKVQYIAEMDTVVKDSLMTLRVQYISPSPLDKRSYFSIDAKVRERIITQTVEQIKEVTFNPDFFVEASARVDTSLSYSLMAGIYPVSFKYLKSYIKAGIIYQDKARGQAEIGLRIEF